MHEAPMQSMITIQDEVRAAFGWSEHADVASADAMMDFLQNHGYWTMNRRKDTFAELKQKLQNAPRVVIIGAAVEKSEITESARIGDVYVAADGAVGALDSYDNLACVVSDFDGAEHLHKAASLGQTIVAHAHGDNAERWRQCLEKWENSSNPPQLIPSHQTNQRFSQMYNFGGFTDGDRALCMVLSCGVNIENIHLLGFSTRGVGHWSGTTENAQKIAKLKWMKQILSQLGFGTFVRS